MLSALADKFGVVPDGWHDPELVKRRMSLNQTGMEKALDKLGINGLGKNIEGLGKNMNIEGLGKNIEGLGKSIDVSLGLGKLKGLGAGWGFSSSSSSEG